MLALDWKTQRGLFLVARATQKPRNRSCLPGNTGEKQWLHPVISEFSTSPQNPKTDIAENKNASDLVELLVKLQVPSRDSCGGVEDPRVPPSTTRVMKKFEKKFFFNWWLRIYFCLPGKVGESLPAPECPIDFSTSFQGLGPIWVF